MLQRFLPAAAIMAAFVLALPVSLAPLRAAPIHPGVTTVKDNFVTLARHRRHHSKDRRAHKNHRGVGVFIVPGLYWGPAWWDSAYSKACWSNIRPCPQCAKNWTFICA